MNYYILLIVMHFSCKAFFNQLTSDYYFSHAMLDKGNALMQAHIVDHANDPLWLYNTAQSYYEKKEYQKAHVYFQQAAIYDKDNDKNIAIKASYQAGNCTVHLKNLQQALQHFESVLHYDANHKEAQEMIKKIKEVSEAQQQSNNDQKKENNSNKSEDNNNTSENNKASNDTDEAQKEKSGEHKERHDNSAEQQQSNEQSHDDNDNLTTQHSKDENESCLEDNKNTSQQQDKQSKSSVQDTSQNDNQEPTASVKETAHTQQDADSLARHLAAQQDALVSEKISAQQLRLLKQVEQADKNAQKVMLQHTQSTHKRDYHEPQW